MRSTVDDIYLPDTIELEEGYRGLTRKTIDHWGLKRVPVPPAGVIHSIPGGVLIPLHNNSGGFCSYSIRKNYEGDSKYYNAAGFSKCYPFGLHLNAQSIIDEGCVWLVEGQFDAIALWQAGYKNVVALMGSFISEHQAMLLLSVTSTLMLCMDGDKVGRKAAKEIKKQWGSVFKISTFDLPDGIDPDEYLLKGGQL